MISQLSREAAGAELASARRGVGDRALETAIVPGTLPESAAPPLRRYVTRFESPDARRECSVVTDPVHAFKNGQSRMCASERSDRA